MEKKDCIKIAVIGAESTGKSTLCADLALHYHTVFVKEYAREYFNEHDINNYTINDIDFIYRKQIEEEKKAISYANRLLFCDTALITGKIWSEEVFKQCSPFVLENIFKNHYDYYLVTDNDLPWVADLQRKNSYNRNDLLSKHLVWLKSNKLPYSIVFGQGEKRLNNAIGEIDTFFNTK